MALIKCPECQSEVSEKAPVCPKCGAPIAGAAQPGVSAAPAPRAVTQQPPLQIRPIGIMVGLIVLGLGIYAAFFFIPEHDRANMIQAGLGDTLARLQTWYFNNDIIGGLKIASWLVIFLGVVQLLVGSAYRSGRLGYCKKCDTQVVGKKKFLGWKCERCGSPVKV